MGFIGFRRLKLSSQEGLERRLGVLGLGCSLLLPDQSFVGIIVPRVIIPTQDC